MAGAAGGLATLRRVGAILGPAAAVLVLQLVLFPLTGSDGSVLPGLYLQGVVLGLLIALVATGMALIYRANRILNFAQSDLGLVPTVLAADLTMFWGFNYFLAAAIGLGAAVLLGTVIELLIVRRFFRASRLILTVATIGLAQLLTVAALLMPMLWDERATSIQLDIPVSWTFTVDPIIFSADHVLALVLAPLALVGVGLFLRYSALGIAVRASAERADRAGLLGIPVRRVQTLVWALAALLSFIGVFLRAGVTGLPFISALSLGGLLLALAALMMGRLTELPTVVASAVALGVFEQAVVWNNSRSPEMVYPWVAVIVLATLVVRRRSTSRADTDTASTWQTADEVRPLPHELRRVPEVLAVRWGGLALVVVAAVGLPLWLNGSGDLRKAAAVCIFAVVGLSIVVLTGWAGQVSLGQMAFAGMGGAAAAYVVETWGFDLALALVAAALAGAVVAVVIGLPALRLPGLFLAVITLAFALACSNWLLNPKHQSWIPRAGFSRPDLFGSIDMASERTMYWVCLGVLGLALVSVLGIRRSRTGRVLLAQRENERAAQSYGINVTRAKLSAFALSGGLAAVAGGLLTVLQEQFSPLLYAPEASFAVFTSAVVGGLGSLAGALLGALYLQGGTWFLPSEWQLLPSALGVLLVLLIVPSGLAGLAYRLRDLWLRSVARRHAIIVPSLLADVRQDPEPVHEAEEAAEAHHLGEPAEAVGGAVGGNS